MSCITIYIIFLMIINASYSQIPSDSVKDLYESLLDGYNTRIRPIKDHNKTTEVIANLRPSLLIGLDTTDQKLSLISRIVFNWKDEFLAWNESEYHGKAEVRLPLDDIWHPTIKIGPSHDGKNIVGHDDNKVVVKSSGIVEWTTEGLINAVCHIDVTYYPFDTQNCIIHMYIADEVSKDVLLSFENSRNNNDFKEENSEWRVIGVGTTLRQVGDRALIKYHLILERRAAFSLFTSILPLVMLYVLNTFVLLVPVCSGEKGSIAITFLLSFSVYISSISENLPTNSLQTPLVLVLMIIMLAHSSTILIIVIEQSRYFHSGNIESIKTSMLYSFVCFRHLTPFPAVYTEEKNTHSEEKEMSTDTNILRRVDRVFFLITFLLNIIIISSFAFIIKFEIV